MKLHEVTLPDDVLAAARRGERRAIEAFYRAASTPAYSLICRIVPRSAAPDVLHDAFLDAIRGLPGFQGEAPLGAWFRRIVVHRCLRHLRSPWQRGRDWLADITESADRLAPRPAPEGLGLDLDTALAQLPAPARLVVWLHDVEGYTHDEIASLVGRTESYSKSQLARAHARLREHLDAGAQALARIPEPQP